MAMETLQLPSDGRPVSLQVAGDLGVGEVTLFLMEDADSILLSKMRCGHRRPGLSVFCPGKQNLPNPGGDVRPPRPVLRC